jgi:pseudoazurin
MRKLGSSLVSLGAGMLLAMALASPRAAAEYEVRLLNKGEAGAMVFEPAFLEIAPGDTVHFRAVDKGHNAASIDGMLPEGGASWKGAMNQDVSVTFEAEGIHGVRCMPHYAMGMVALIVVGDPSVNLAAAREVKHTGRARQQMAELLARVDG